MDGEDTESRVAGRADATGGLTEAESQLPLFDDLRRIADRLRELGRTQEKLQTLLAAMLAISRDLDMHMVLRRIVSTAMGLVDARYGAMGVLSQDGDGLSEFIPEGLSEEERAGLDGVGDPHGRGLLGELIRDPRPLRVDDIADHPASSGFPAGHPRMGAFLGVAITVQGRVYGNLYLANPRGGRRFDSHDEDVLVALAGAAAVAIENARLYEQVRAGAERFQRLLLPSLPDLGPFGAAAVYRPATEPDQLGGDWYDALLFADGSCAVVIGDVCGHDLTAAAAMSQTRSMLRALVYNEPETPGALLARLDATLDAMPTNPMTTTLMARIEPDGDAWTLRWSNAGHPPPLLVLPGRAARLLDDEPGPPLGVDPALPRPDHSVPLPAGATLVLFTDGLIEDHRRAIDEGLRALADSVSAHADLSPERLCRFLTDRHPSDGHDDIAVLVLRTPAR